MMKRTIKIGGMLSFLLITSSVWVACSKYEETAPDPQEEMPGTPKLQAVYLLKMQGGTAPYSFTVQRNCEAGSGFATSPGGTSPFVRMLNWIPTQPRDILTVQGSTYKCGIPYNLGQLELIENANSTCPPVPVLPGSPLQTYYFTPNQGPPLAQRRSLKLELKNLGAVPGPPPDLFFTYDVPTNTWSWDPAMVGPYFCASQLAGIPGTCC